VSYRIGIIGGDGIGPEVVAEAMKVVDAAGVDYEAVSFELGGARYLRDGVVLDDEHLDAIRGLDAVMLGAVGTPEVPPGVIERGLLLALRFELDLYVNHRPFVSGPNRFNDGVDMVVVRENTEGTYAGEGGFLRKDTPNEIATQGSVNTRMGAEPSATRSTSRGAASASTSPWCTRPTCSRSPATCGSVPSTTWPASTPTWTPRTTMSTPRASTSCRIPAVTT
jgi:isocitrate/isopropylmalate dehydrogenase